MPNCVFFGYVSGDELISLQLLINYFLRNKFGSLVCTWGESFMSGIRANPWLHWMWVRMNYGLVGWVHPLRKRNSKEGIS